MNFRWTVEMTNEILHIDNDTLFLKSNSSDIRNRGYKLVKINDVENSKTYNFAEVFNYLYPYDIENNYIHKIIAVYENNKSGPNWKECFILDLERSELMQLTIKKRYNISNFITFPYFAVFKSLDINSNYEIRLLTKTFGLFFDGIIEDDYYLLYCPKTTPSDYIPFAHDYANFERKIYVDDRYSAANWYDFVEVDNPKYFNYSNYPNLDENIYVSDYNSNLNCVNKTNKTVLKYSFVNQPYFRIYESSCYISKTNTNYPFADSRYNDLPDTINIYSNLKNSFVYVKKNNLINVINNEYDECILIYITTTKQGNLIANIKGSLSGDSNLSIELNSEDLKMYIYVSDENCYYECSITESITDLFSNKTFAKVVIDESNTNHSKYPETIPFLHNKKNGILYGYSGDNLAKNIVASYNLIYDAEKNIYFPQLIADFKQFSD